MATIPVPSRLHAILREETKKNRQPLYFVGGPVRDALLGRLCHDLDFVTRNARSLANGIGRRLGARLIVLDDLNKIYRLVWKSIEPAPVTLDFAELQGNSILEDLARRDFTINAMALELGKSTPIDPFNGKRDLKREIIRAVSEKAFLEDPLRLLRAYRFSAQFQFTIDPKTQRWISRHARRLQARPVRLGGSPVVARERVREELLRLLAQSNAGSSIRDMDQTGLLTALIPELEVCRRTARSFYGVGGVLKHSIETVEHLDWIDDRLRGKEPFPDYFHSASVRQVLQSYLKESIGGFPRIAWLRLGGLLHDIGKPATAKRIGGRLRFFGHEDVGADSARLIGAELRFSRQELQITSQWVRHHMRLGNLAAANVLSDKAIARYFRDQQENGLGMVLISLADHYGYLARGQWGKGKDGVEKAARRMLESYVLTKEKVLPPRLLDGHQIMKALRLKPGPLIGKLLEALADAQAGGRLKTIKEAFGYLRRVKNKIST